MRSFLKFGLLSGGGWLLDCFLLLMLTSVLQAPLFAANFVSSSVAALSVFMVSRLLVFEPAGDRYLLKTVLYALYTATVIVCASGLIGVANWFSHAGIQWLGTSLTEPQHAFVAKVLITPPQLIANFFMSRFLLEKLSQRKYE